MAADAPDLYANLRGRALPVIVVSVISGVSSLALIFARRHILARFSAALAVAAVLWAWAAAQYPVLLPPAVSIEAAAGHPAMLATVLAALAVGSLLLVPSLLWLFFIFHRAERSKPVPD